jgi:hypothetical protein
MVMAKPSAAPSAAAWPQPKPCPGAPGCSMTSTPANPTRAAPIRSGPSGSRNTKKASGTSHRVRVNDRALASARGRTWKA